MADEGNDDDLATMAALKSLNLSIHNSLGGQQLANSFILQVLVNVLERKLGPEFRSTFSQGLKETWETSFRVVGDQHPIVAHAQETLQQFINSLEGK
ncbi:hypothetical protein [Paracoccus sp. 22332]|uniref:hypothetical protein n=1 Tax=Paracoccus sp. 22332 TaxID=3453913 RepID=UPI003F82C831